MDVGSATQPPVRCAIYTRQSVVRAGPDRALASCAAQREKCIDFVAGRRRHGWHALDENFDDEAYSGASVVGIKADWHCSSLYVNRLERTRFAAGPDVLGQLSHPRREPPPTMR